MTSRLSGFVVVALLLSACGSAGPTAAPTATVAPTPTVEPTPTLEPTPASATASVANPFAGQPFSLTLPEGWRGFDLNDPAGKAAIDQVVVANPQLGPAIKAFQAMPNVVFMTNPLLGNVVIALSLPSGGLPLDTLKESFDAQFMAVPGVEGTPVAEDMTLPAGKAVHWDIKLSVNGPGGQKIPIEESLYLTESGTNAVLVEFVATNGAPIPQEQQIIQSLTLAP